MGLFDHESRDEAQTPAPLAERMRPRDLDELVGQPRLLGADKPLRRAIERDDLRSLILWGPPGSGKTTLAKIIAARTRAAFVPFSAVLSGIREVREVMRGAAERHRATGQRTILFIDEIHRFNKAQQDAFLPYVEQGTVVLIGATTENPSFEVISPLLSRSRVYRLDRLDDQDLLLIMRRALTDSERGLGAIAADIPDEVLAALAVHSQGDARAALNTLELLLTSAHERDGRKYVDLPLLEEVLQSKALYYDKAGEQHFNLISALHKSMRNSDPDATLYWAARMLDSGEDPLYIVRRIVRFASEDVGLADPRALTVAVAAKQAVHFIGRPEADLAIAEAAVYCALAPKSNALYTAWQEALDAARSGAGDPVPLQLRNAPTGLMKAEGYGRGYRYAHDHADAVTPMECLPPRLAGSRFYRPVERGFEKTLHERLERWLAARRKPARKGRS